MLGRSFSRRIPIAAVEGVRGGKGMGGWREDESRREGGGTAGREIGGGGGRGRGGKGRKEEARGGGGEGWKQ